MGPIPPQVYSAASSGQTMTFVKKSVPIDGNFFSRPVPGGDTFLCQEQGIYTVVLEWENMSIPNDRILSVVFNKKRTAAGSSVEALNTITNYRGTAKIEVDLDYADILTIRWAKKRRSLAKNYKGTLAFIRH